MTIVADSRRRAARSAARILRERMRPPARLTISEWADRFRVLSPESSPEPGRWRTDRAPYLREIMDTLGDPMVRRVVWVAASQVGKTEVVNNFVGFRVHQDPGPMLVVQPSLEMAKIWSKDRLAPMIRDTPVLRGKVKDPRARDSGNTILHKVFPGGRMAIVGANSASGLSARPIRDAIFDEVDRYPPSAGSEGDPVSLGVQRTRNFWNRKLAYVSSPGELRTSRIWPEWLVSDQRRFYVPCPHCDHFQVLKWKGGVQWESAEIDGQVVHDPETAAYVCEACGALIEEVYKRRMLDRGEWRPENAEKGTFPGFHLSALYSPWVTWAELAALWFEKKRTTEELQTFINLQLGEPWEERDHEIEPKELVRRAEKYPAEVPHGVGLLTAFTDVQGDRLEITIRGWGEGEESWMIGHHRIHGDPEADEVWEELEHFRTRQWVHESGARMRIRAFGIDSGFLDHRVCAFVKGKEGQQCYAVRGSDSRLKNPLSRATRKNRHKVRPWTADSHHFKTILFRRLRKTLTTDAEEPGGPGYMHFCKPTVTGADAEYFAQFEAEIPKLVRAGRRFQRVFVQVRERNESIDLEAGNIIMLHTLGQEKMKRLGKLAERASRERKEDEEKTEVEPPSSPTPTRPRKAPRGSWANRWK